MTKPIAPTAIPTIVPTDRPFDFWFRLEPPVGVLNRHELSLDGATKRSMSVPPFLPSESMIKKATCVCAVILAFQMKLSAVGGEKGRTKESELPGMNAWAEIILSNYRCKLKSKRTNIVKGFIAP